MAHGDSVVDKVASVYGQYLGASLGGVTGFLGAKKAEDALTPPKPAVLQTPSALSETPTESNAQGEASRRTLDRERMAASTSAVLTGGQGLLDEPTTTSRVLVGA